MKYYFKQNVTGTFRATTYRSRNITADTDDGDCTSHKQYASLNEDKRLSAKYFFHTKSMQN